MGLGSELGLNVGVSALARGVRGLECGAGIEGNVVFAPL